MFYFRLHKMITCKAWPYVLESCNVTENHYYEAVKNNQNKLSVIFILLKWTLGLITLLVCYVTRIYTMLIYLTFYLCKPEHAMDELMIKSAKEVTGKEVMQKLHAIWNIFLTKCKVSSHEATKRIICIYRNWVCSNRF